MYIIAKLGGLAKRACLALTVPALTIPALTITALPANAQNNPIAGTWQCGMSYTEYNRDGSRNSGFTENSILYLQPDGTYSVQGQQMGIGGTWGYQGQGRWQIENTPQGLAAFGRGVRSDPSFGQSPHSFAAYLGPQGQYLYNQIDTPQPNGAGLQARTNFQCQRG